MYEFQDILPKEMYSKVQVAFLNLRHFCLVLVSEQDLDDIEDENEQLKQENKTLLKVVGQLTR